MNWVKEYIEQEDIIIFIIRTEDHCNDFDNITSMALKLCEDIKVSISKLKLNLYRYSEGLATCEYGIEARIDKPAMIPKGYKNIYQVCRYY